MNNKELRDIFKYKKFSLSSDNSVFYFELDKVFRDGEYIGNYLVKDNSGRLTIELDPINLGPFQNIWVITGNGEKILFNELMSKLKSGDTIILKQIPTEDDQIPISIREKLEELAKEVLGE